MASASNKVVLFLPARVDPSIGDLPAADLQPLELLHIASPAEAAGFEVVVIDAMTEPDYLDQVLKACEGAMAFGSSCILGYQVFDGAMVATEVRKRFPTLPILWGGWFPSSIPELYLRSNICDAVVMGQGEITFVECLKAIEAKKSFDDIAGLALLRNDKVVMTPRRAVVHLDELPPPSWHLIDLNKYYALNAMTAKKGNRIRNRLPTPDPFKNKPYRGISYFSSFGCPEPCEFCCSPEIAGRRWVALDPVVLVQRLVELHQKWPYDILRLQDANFGVSEKRTKVFCQELIKSGINIQWNGTIEIKQICQYSDETLDLMKESGCHLGWFGAEAATDETQKLIKKNIKEGLTDTAMRRMHERNIQSGLTWIIGYPDETPESMRTTIMMAAEMKWKYPTCSSEVFPYRPIPGSGFWEPSLKLGYVAPKTFEDWGRFFDYKFNSWWGQIPPEIQKLWKRFTVLAPWFDGLAGGRGPVSKLIRASAGWRLRNQTYDFPVEFKAYDVIRRVAGEKFARAI